MCPSYAPPKEPCHKPLSQDVPRRRGPSKLSIDWRVRAADALPKLETMRNHIGPYQRAHVHWSEAVGHMHAVLEGRITTNKDAKHTFLLAQRAALRALSLMPDG